MRDFLKQFEMRQWRDDIETFARWKAFFLKAKSEETRKAAHKYLCDIQQRWPQFIKKNEVPELGD